MAINLDRSNLSLESLKDKLSDYDSLKNEQQFEQRRRNFKKESDMNSNRNRPSSSYTPFHYNKPNWSSKKGSENGYNKNTHGNNRQGKEVICYNCNEKGHIAPNCPKRKDTGIKRPSPETQKDETKRFKTIAAIQTGGQSDESDNEADDPNYSSSDELIQLQDS